MNNQSRTAARDSFTHQRAHFAFSHKPVVAQVNSRLTRSAGELHSRMDIVRKGLLGFTPASASP
jgi:hypothetical protein